MAKRRCDLEGVWLRVGMSVSGRGGEAERVCGCLWAISVALSSN